MPSKFPVRNLQCNNEGRSKSYNLSLPKERLIAIQFFSNTLLLKKLKNKTYSVFRLNFCACEDKKREVYDKSKIWLRFRIFERITESL